MNFHVCVLAALTICASAYAQPVAGVGDDAAAMLEEIKRTYAYPERIEEGWARRFRSLADRIDILETRSDLLDFAEEALHRLCDHHAITGPSSQRSAALVPSFADLWIEAADADDYVISQVRQGSPAAHADIRVGDRLLAVNGLPMPKAIDRFWRGEPPQGASCLSYAARVLASGPRNGLRALSLQRDGALFEAELDSLYNTDVERGDGPVSIRWFKDDIVCMGFNDSLGDSATITAFDAVMLEAPSGARFVIDMLETLFLNMFRALQNVTPFHLADQNLYDFVGIKTTGDEVEEGDIAFDALEFDQPMENKTETNSETGPVTIELVDL